MNEWSTNDDRARYGYAGDVEQQSSRQRETLTKGIEDCEVERDANDGIVSRCEGRIRPKWVDL